jgi:hypothetical protein
MEDESDIVNLLWFLNEYIDSEEYQKDIYETNLTNLLNIFDQYNRIYTVNYNNFSFNRYILVENNKILKITYQKNEDSYIVTKELFSNASDYVIETYIDNEERRHIRIIDSMGNDMCNDEYLSMYNQRVFQENVPIIYILEPITINDLNEKLNIKTKIKKV